MKNLEAFFLIGMIVFACLSLSTEEIPDLSGKWEGTCKKYEGSSSYYLMEMDIVQKGKEVKGQNSIAYQHKKWYCKKNFKGEFVTANQIYFEDKTMVRHKHEFGSYWLYLSGRLTYDAKEDKLYGWVSAYDPNYNEYFEKHDYIELYRKNHKYACL